MEFLKENYPGKFEYIEERDLFDYIYDGESMRTLSRKKKCEEEKSYKYFLKEYEGRFEYRLLDENDFEDCLKLLNEWTSNKEENNAVDEDMEEEFIGIKKLFANY